MEEQLVDRWIGGRRSEEGRLGRDNAFMEFKKRDRGWVYGPCACEDPSKAIKTTSPRLVMGAKINLISRART
jgi:hypothetical protein